jgi:hypothetical protein
LLHKLSLFIWICNLSKNLQNVSRYSDCLTLIQRAQIQVLCLLSVLTIYWCLQWSVFTVSSLFANKM